jgi:transposase
LITKSKSKSDRIDAGLLARLGRVDPKLLSPVHHRCRKAQLDLVTVRTRAELIGMRTSLVNHVRGVVKCHGERLPKCSTEAFAKRACAFLPEELRLALTPVLDLIKGVNVQIKVLDERISKELPKRYPEIDVLQQVDGVGPLTALTFVLTLDDPSRFRKSRKVGAFLGLRPGRSQSGRSDPELRITKTGDSYLRTLLVNCAQYIMGPFGKDSDLRRWGLHLAERGKKNAKKRAVVAVARRLAVLLHRLWVTGEVYQPVGYAASRCVA